MVDHVFGKTLNRKFIAYENNEPILLNSLNSVGLYSTITDATAGSNVICSMSSWTTNPSNPFAAIYNLPSVSDPSPTSTRTTWQLWEKIQYKLDSSGDTQTEYRAIDIERAQIGDSEPGTTAAELKSLFPALAAYLSDSRVDEILDLAALQMKIDLTANGVEYPKARKLQETKLALTYLGIAMCAESQYVKTRQEGFYVRAQDYRKLYSDTLSKIKLPYDSDGDGAVDSVKIAQPNFRYVPR